MIKKQVTLPTIGLIAGTRAALGIGIGLLLAGRLSAEARRSVGWALFAIGALSTIPLAAEVLCAKSDGAEGLRVEENPISPFVTAAHG